MRAGAAEAHGDDEIGAEKDRGLAIVDHFGGGEFGGARHDEQLLPVSLGLGQLARVERILDRQRVQPELRGKPVHFV